MRPSVICRGAVFVSQLSMSRLTAAGESQETAWGTGHSI